MPAPINRSGLYYLFHCNSKDLSAKEQKKFKNINIALGFSFGIGHFICFTAYLIQKSCAKASKTNKVAQDQLNRKNNASSLYGVSTSVSQKNGEVKIPSGIVSSSVTNTVLSNLNSDDSITSALIKKFANTPKTFEDFFPYMRKKIRDCVDEFEKTLPLYEIGEIKIETDLPVTISFSEKQGSVDKECMISTITEAMRPKLEDLRGKGSKTLWVTLTSLPNNNRQLIITASLIAIDGKYFGEGGPNYHYKEINSRIPEDLLLAMKSNFLPF